jgi:signal transduction histidine kinase
MTISLKGGIKEIELSVKDTGVGIPKGQQERVFSKFFRGANVIRMEAEGSGLGLFITKNIIEAHGGRIWFNSEENKGATFYFVLPLKKT